MELPQQLSQQLPQHYIDVLEHQANQLADKPGFHAVFFLSSDGLLIAKSSDLGGDEADNYAAAASGIYSLAKEFPLGEVEQVFIVQHQGRAVVTGCGTNSRLVAFTSVKADPGTVGYLVKSTVEAIKMHTASQPRSEVA